MSKIKKRKSNGDVKKGPKKKYPFSFMYHGRMITINKKKKAIALTIDGTDIPVSRDGGMLLATMHSPYSPMYYPNCLEELAMFVTDSVINMRNDFDSKKIFGNPTY